MDNKPTKKPTLVEKAYEILKEQIVSMEIPPGSKIEESLLIEKLQIGRTPIREALRLLISEGLVISYGSNATYIKDLSIKSAKDLLSLIHFMGSLIFDLVNIDNDFSDIISELKLIYSDMEKAINQDKRYLWANLNAFFHKTMAHAADNQYLDTILERIYSEEIRLAYMISIVQSKTPLRSDYYNLLQEQHLEMIDLLAKKDIEGLKKVYRKHLKTGEKRLLFYFSQGQ